MPEEIRLQAYMANCGVASRRKCEEIITSGRVKVNGIVVDKLGSKVSSKDVVTVDGRIIEKEEHVYYVLNKPRGYVTTLDDEFGRKKVIDLFAKEDLAYRIFPIGRLDYDTQGVLLFTNDGELANKLTSPHSNVEKEYLARVEGKAGKEELAKLVRGVVINGYKTKPAEVEVIEYKKDTNTSLLRLIITEGKYHQVKNMCEAVGLPVKRLTRLRFATISTEGIAKGEYRRLKIHEVKQLYNL
jgi:23S rRNA pseudouridine2605 synthase